MRTLTEGLAAERCQCMDAISLDFAVFTIQIFIALVIHASISTSVTFFFSSLLSPVSTWSFEKSMPTCPSRHEITLNRLPFTHGDRLIFLAMISFHIHRSSLKHDGYIFDSSTRDRLSFITWVHLVPCPLSAEFAWLHGEQQLLETPKGSQLLRLLYVTFGGYTVP